MQRITVIVVFVVLQTYLGRSRWTQLPWPQPTVRRSASVSVVQHGPPVWYPSVTTAVLQPDVLFRGCLRSVLFVIRPHLQPSGLHPFVNGTAQTNALTGTVPSSDGSGHRDDVVASLLAQSACMAQLQCFEATTRSSASVADAP